MNEPAAWMYLDDLERFETSETFAQAFSVQVVSPMHGESVPLYRHSQPATPSDRWCPDFCPITGLPFFMWLEHHETGKDVPTYGGPYDSYTIPVRDESGEYIRERYDHDLGGWVTDEIEDVGIQIVSDQAFVYDDERPQPAAHWQGLTDEERDEIEKNTYWNVPHVPALFDAIEQALKEKNS